MKTITEELTGVIDNLRAYNREHVTTGSDDMAILTGALVNINKTFTRYVRDIGEHVLKADMINDSIKTPLLNLDMDVFDTCCDTGKTLAPAIQRIGEIIPDFNFTGGEL